ncbi:hypothetical protein MVEN_01082600 [Mycena venus]|uniref:Uncharacterized protein n=1 Tax=Mycena venus TaxID=2733690 RepID=A0A8H6Y8S2_9AGAR|nr:hypothetical protein MVEN_01082600 [Mycena venus]
MPDETSPLGAKQNRNGDYGITALDAEADADSHKPQVSLPTIVRWIQNSVKPAFISSFLSSAGLRAVNVRWCIFGGEMLLRLEGVTVAGTEAPKCFPIGATYTLTVVIMASG